MSPPFADHDELTLAEVYSTKTFTASRTSLGIFQVTFSTPQPNADYTILLAVQAWQATLFSTLAVNTIGYYNQTVNGFTVTTINGKLLVDTIFTFSCMSNGKIFAQGKVDVLGPVIVNPTVPEGSFAQIMGRVANQNYVIVTASQDDSPVTFEIPTDDSDWSQYANWDSSNNTVVSTNGLYTLSNTGITVLQAGNYRITCTMTARCEGTDPSALIAFRIAKNAETYSSDQKVPIGSLTVTKNMETQSESKVGAGTLVNILQLSANDKVTIHCCRTDNSTHDVLGNSNNTKLLVEYVSEL